MSGNKLREIAEEHYASEPIFSSDNEYKEKRIAALEKLLVKHFPQYLNVEEEKPKCDEHHWIADKFDAMGFASERYCLFCDEVEFIN